MATETTCVSHDSFKLHIMILMRNSADLLERISQSDEVWPAKICAQCKKGQRPVVATTTHSEPVALCIEADQRCKNYIHLARAAPLAITAGRFSNAEAVVKQLTVGCKGCKAKFSSGDYRKKDFTSAPPGCADNGTAVEFAGYRKIQGQTSAAGHYRQAPDAGGNPPGCLLYLFCGQCPTLREQMLAIV